MDALHSLSTPPPTPRALSGLDQCGFQGRGLIIWGLGMDGNSKKRARLHCLWRKGPQFAPQRFPEAFLWVGIDFTRVSPLPSLIPAAAQVAENCLKDPFQS